MRIWGMYIYATYEPTGIKHVTRNTIHKWHSMTAYNKNDNGNDANADQLNMLSSQLGQINQKLFIIIHAPGWPTQDFFKSKIM